MFDWYRKVGKQMEELINMKNLIVYGTLKQQNMLNHHLRDAIYIGPIKLFGYKMFNSNYGFPWAHFTESQKDYIYGEAYAVSNETLRQIDSVESEGALYNRVNITDSEYNLKYLNNPPFDEPTYLYLGNYKHPMFDIHQGVQVVNFGYWAPKWEQKKYNKVFNVSINDRFHSDNAEKIVFDMRFYDFSNAQTNLEYMEKVSNRFKKIYKYSVNKKIEEIFITDLILHDKAKEILTNEQDYNQRLH